MLELGAYRRIHCGGCTAYFSLGSIVFSYYNRNAEDKCCLSVQQSSLYPALPVTFCP